MRAVLFTIMVAMCPQAFAQSFIFQIPSPSTAQPAGAVVLGMHGAENCSWPDAYGQSNVVYNGHYFVLNTRNIVTGATATVGGIAQPLEHLSNNQVKITLEATAHMYNEGLSAPVIITNPDGSYATYSVNIGVTPTITGIESDDSYFDTNHQLTILNSLANHRIVGTGFLGKTRVARQHSELFGLQSDYNINSDLVSNASDTTASVTAHFHDSANTVCHSDYASGLCLEGITVTRYDCATGEYVSRLSYDGQLDQASVSEYAAVYLEFYLGPVYKLDSNGNGTLVDPSVGLTAGETVSLSSSGFVDGSKIYLGGFELDIVSVTADPVYPSGLVSITAKIPENIAPGNHKFTVSLPSNTINNLSEAWMISNVYLVKQPIPALTSMTPTWATPGEAVTITGSNFASTGMTVKLGTNAVSSYTYISPTQISFSVPSLGVTSYTITVVNSTGSASNGLLFNLINSLPTLTSITSTAYPQRPTAIGSNISTRATAQLTGGGLIDPLIIGNRTSFSFATPDLVTGVYNLSVRNPSGLSASRGFQLKSAITALSPSSATTGTTVTVTGTGFRSGMSLYVNGVLVTPTYVSQTTLTFVMPSGIPAGTRSVSVTYTGIPSNSVNLTVY